MSDFGNSFCSSKTGGARLVPNHFGPASVMDGCSLFSSFHFTYSLDSVIDSVPQVPHFEIYSMYSLLIFIRIASYLGSFLSAFVLKLTASRHHLRPPPVPIMDAQWQQYYWNHYLEPMKPIKYSKKNLWQQKLKSTHLDLPLASSCHLFNHPSFRATGS